MRYQMHHQSKKDSNIIEMIAQSDDYEDAKEIDKWSRGVTRRHPLPDGYQWLMCNEKSEHFVCTFNEESVSPIVGIMGVKVD